MYYFFIINICILFVYFDTFHEFFNKSFFKNNCIKSLDIIFHKKNIKYFVTIPKSIKSIFGIKQ